jgi:hypothetical protein
MGLLTRLVDAAFGEPPAPPTAHDVAGAKGTDFEKYVIKRFPEKWFALHDWTRDTPDKTCGKRVESNGNPDLVMRYKPSDALMAVECKFRSNLYKGALNYSNASQLKRYNAYMKSAKIPVYIVIGLGGAPSNPCKMFCVPLEAAKYPALYSSIYEKYERDPTKNFFWDGHKLK